MYVVMLPMILGVTEPKQLRDKCHVCHDAVDVTWVIEPKGLRDRMMMLVVALSLITPNEPRDGMMRLEALVSAQRDAEMAPIQVTAVTDTCGDG